VEKPVVIGNNVWIAAHCFIVPGVTIGDHAVIGADSVVPKDIPPWSMAVGNPAKVIRSRLALAEEASGGVTARSKHRGQSQGTDPEVAASDGKDS
jgi:acetyltransferase-like isoleucine patch superfamily enzyme